MIGVEAGLALLFDERAARGVVGVVDVEGVPLLVVGLAVLDVVFFELRDFFVLTGLAMTVRKGASKCTSDCIPPLRNLSRMSCNSMWNLLIALLPGADASILSSMRPSKYAKARH